LHNACGMTRDQFVFTGCIAIATFLAGVNVGAQRAEPARTAEEHFPPQLASALPTPFIAPAMGLDRYMDCPSTGRRWQLAQKADRNPITIDCAYMDETLDTQEAL